MVAHKRAELVGRMSPTKPPSMKRLALGCNVTRRYIASKPDEVIPVREMHEKVRIRMHDLRAYLREHMARDTMVGRLASVYLNSLN